ncbi:hypothetical protein OAO01_04435 [Oligoflexia bacterium]|nr:hypothetical protein [Oligoflexia bacterium]
MNGTTEKVPGSPVASFIFSFGIAFLIFGLLAKTIAFWTPSAPKIIGSYFPTYVGALLLVLVALGLAKFRLKSINLNVHAFALMLVLLFFGDWLSRGYNLLQGPFIRGEIILLGSACFFVLRYRWHWLFNLIAILTPFILAYCFFITSDGRLLFSDDHATFHYRLFLLKENFPFIPFFNPQWNGGVDARDFFATGTLNIFLLSSPLLYLFEVKDVYNIIIVLLLFFLAPLGVYLAAKIEKLPAPSPAIATILALTVSLLWYRWVLRYGTLGFATTAALIPLNLALIGKILCRERSITRTEAILSTISITLMLLWTPSGIAFLPAIILGIFSLKRLFKKKYVLAITLGLFVINLPWVLLFWSASSVSTFLVDEKPVDMITQDRTPDTYPSGAESTEDTSVSSNLAISAKVLQEGAISTNPLLLFFLLPGLFLIRRNSRLLYLLTFAWLFLLGTVFVPIKPQLELDRMLVILGLCGCLPAALAIQKLITFSDGKPRGAKILLPAFVCGMLLAAIFSTGSILRNRTIVPYYFADPIVDQIIETIQTHNEGGRVLFSGFILHHLSHGHVAPLAYLADTPMIASSHVHNLWKYKQVFPRSYIARDEEGIREYLDTYNVTTIVTHEQRWRKFFLERPQEFKLVWKNRRFFLFKRLKYDSNYFYKGSGKVVSQSTDAVTLKLSTASATLKFNYFPFLKSSHCSISGEKVSDEVTLIKLTACPTGVEITVKSKSAFSRI